MASFSPILLARQYAGRPPKRHSPSPPGALPEVGGPAAQLQIISSLGRTNLDRVEGVPSKVGHDRAIVLASPAEQEGFETAGPPYFLKEAQLSSSGGDVTIVRAFSRLALPSRPQAHARGRGIRFQPSCQPTRDRSPQTPGDPDGIRTSLHLGRGGLNQLRNCAVALL